MAEGREDSPREGTGCGSDDVNEPGLWADTDVPVAAQKGTCTGHLLLVVIWFVACSALHARNEAANMQVTMGTCQGATVSPAYDPPCPCGERETSLVQASLLLADTPSFE
jgi:hypothetical protein